MTLTALPWMVAHADSSCTALAISPSSPARRSCACSGSFAFPSQQLASCGAKTDSDAGLQR